MSGPRFTRKQREARRAEVASLYLKGERQMNIAKALGVSDEQISQDLKILVKRWQQSALTDIDAKKGIELAKIDQLEATYWDAWARSLQPRERSETGRSENGHIKSSAKLVREQRDGNPAFLQGVQWCINKRCEILGLDAPKQIKLVEEEAAKLASKYGFDKARLVELAEAIALGKA